MVSISGKPIQLVQNNHGILDLNETAAAKISCLDGLLGIVTIIGPYRTGKSFIMNRLLNRSDGFRVGDIIESCTKGVWMWDNIIKHTNKAGHPMNFIIFDIEGLESPDSTSEWDIKIFILAYLMSSLFLYNTKNVINKESIKRLGIISSLKDYIKTNEEETIKYFKSDRPGLIWVLRDFLLLNKRIPDREYLIKSLEPEDTQNNEKAINERNNTRKLFESSFTSLDCITMPLPITIEGYVPMEVRLQKLSTIRYNKLRHDFREKVEILCEKVKRNISLKGIYGRPLNGPIFIEMMKRILNKLNENEQINLIESLSASIRSVAEDALEKAKQIFVNSFENYLKKVLLPIPWKEFEENEALFIDASYKILINMIIGSDGIMGEYVRKLEKFICGDLKTTKQINNGKLCEYRTKNSVAMYNFNKNIIEFYWNEKMKPIRTVNGVIKINDFEKRVISIENIYTLKAFEGPEKSKAHSDFLEALNIETIKASVENWSVQCEKLLEEKENSEREKAVLDKQKQDINVMLRNIEIEEVNIEKARNDEVQRRKWYSENLNDEEPDSKDEMEKLDINDVPSEDTPMKQSVEQTNTKFDVTEVSTETDDMSIDSKYLMEKEKTTVTLESTMTQTDGNDNKYEIKKEKTKLTFEIATTQTEIETENVNKENKRLLDSLNNTVNSMQSQLQNLSTNYNKMATSYNDIVKEVNSIKQKQTTVESSTCNLM